MPCHRTAVRLLPLSIVFGLALAGCGGQPHGSARVSVARIPDFQLGPLESVSGLDLAVDDAARMHVLWRLTRSGPRGNGRVLPPEYSVWYRRSTNAGSAWTTPVCIDRGDGLRPRMEKVGDELHVICGKHLRHFVSTDTGSTWALRDSLILVADTIETWARRSSAEFEDTTLRVAFLGYGRGHKVGGSNWGWMQLRLVTSSPFGARREQVLMSNRNDPYDQADPCIARNGAELLLVCSDNGMKSKDTASANGGKESLGWPSGNVLLLRSRDGGRTWSQPVALFPEAGSGALKGWVTDIAIDTSSNGVCCLLAAGALYVAPINEAGWGVPLRLGSVIPFVNEGMDSHAFALTADRGTRQIAWTDEPSPGPRDLIERVAFHRPFPVRLNLASVQLGDGSATVLPKAFESPRYPVINDFLVRRRGNITVILWSGKRDSVVLGRRPQGAPFIDYAIVTDGSARRANRGN